MTTENKNAENIEEPKRRATKKPKSDSTSKSTRSSSEKKTSAKSVKSSTATTSKTTAPNKSIKSTVGTKKSAKATTSAKKPETKIEQKTASKNKPALIQQYFQTTAAQTLIEEFQYTSRMQVPKIQKIVLNIGLGEALINSKALENATKDLTLIAGQKPVPTKAKKSIATYKLREGQIIGVMVTLRKRRMYEFLERLIISALPRIRDFHGVPIGSFDGRGNYSLGIREQIIFPEIEYGSVDKMRGLQIAIVTSSNTNEESKRLLELLGMPFERKENSRQVA